ncbi:MAG: sugar ABC transporter permease [Myxococcota bacterium]
MMTVIRYAALAALLTTGGYLVLAHFVNRDKHEAFQTRRVELTARALAFVAAQENVREDDEAIDSTQVFATDLKAKVPNVESALVLKRIKYFAHSDAALVGKRLAKDSLADKALYDASRSLSADVKKNIEERERNPELKRNAFPEYDVETKDGVLSVMVPVKEGTRVRAVAQVSARPVAVSSAFPVWVIGVGLIGFLLVAGLSFAVRGPALFGLGTTALAFTILAQATAYQGWSEQTDAALRAEMAKTYAALGASGLLKAETPDASAVPALQVTAKGIPDTSLSSIAVAGSDAAPAASYDVDGYRVSYDTATIASQGMSPGTLAWTIAFALLGCGLFLLGAIGRVDRDAKILWGHREAYAYMASAMIGMMVLVFVPVVYGISLGFQQREYNEFKFSGLDNFAAILSDFNVAEPTNFYFTLGVTIMWTAVNVVLHVSIGLFLALLLNDQFLKARALFRVVLILPWAVPNYITALIWKGMFHKQFGAINQMLEAVGIGGVAWFQSFWPSFFTNVATNTWLGFPFMMVVALGALQSIPNDLYEAAIVDGASRWQRFRNITIPLLMPALVPAVIVGSVWTFNMFNIIYLVSGGAPNGATDILITDAFRWAFERDRYGYAAAYSTVIFLILAIFTTITNRITGATKGAFE